MVKNIKHKPEEQMQSVKWLRTKSAEIKRMGNLDTAGMHK